MKPSDRLIPLIDVPPIIAELTGIQRGKGTVYKWAKNGCRTHDGRIVKLKSVKRLGQIFTTRENIETFIKEVG